MGLNSYVYEFSIAYNIIDISNTIDSHKYFMKKHDVWIFGYLENNVWNY